MRKIAYLMLAFILTLPIAAAIVWLAFLTPWFANGGWWDFVEPVLRLFGSAGVAQSDWILTGALLAASLALAALIAWLTARMEGRWNQRRAMRR